MLAEHKVTDQSNESGFADIVAGDNVIQIPLFQRRYRWSEKNLKLLLEDARSVGEEVQKSAFLGVLVCVNRGTVPGRPTLYDIVDGQQRLTTLYLQVLACADVLADKGHAKEAASFIQTYLLVRPLADNPVNTKLIPCYQDRAQFKAIWDSVKMRKSLKDDPTFKSNIPSPPQTSGAPTGLMATQYARMKKEAAGIYKTGGFEKVVRFCNTLATQCSFVLIALRDPSAAPKIFERLNDRAEKITTADLVRNEVFARAHDLGTAQHVFTNQWEPFQHRFSQIGGLDGFLFPYGLIKDSNLTKADLFRAFRTIWNGKEPSEIIDDMERYVPTFLALEAGELSKIQPESLRIRLRRIVGVGRPTSIYPFILSLIEALKVNEVKIEQCHECLDVIESFLMRRAICGVEPTGLHSVFKGMWGELKNPKIENLVEPRICGENVARLIRKRTTVDWPDIDRFKTAITNDDLYSRRVCKYALTELELSQKSETPADDFQIEHILPQTHVKHWDSFDKDQHKKLVNTWANLVPLSSAMNASVGQEPYDKKRQRFSTSMFATPKEVGVEFAEWKPETLTIRANAIADWAAKRWAY